jgi:hypothetical protein
MIIKCLLFIMIKLFFIKTGTNIRNYFEYPNFTNTSLLISMRGFP